MNRIRLVLTILFLLAAYLLALTSPFLFNANSNEQILKTLFLESGYLVLILLAVGFILRIKNGRYTQLDSISYSQMPGLFFVNIINLFLYITTFSLVNLGMGLGSNGHVTAASNNYNNYVLLTWFLIHVFVIFFSSLIYHRLRPTIKISKVLIAASFPLIIAFILYILTDIGAFLLNTAKQHLN